MAILRSLDGKFYNIPDDQLERHLVPADEVKQHLGDALEANASIPKTAATTGSGISLPSAGKAVLGLFAGSSGKREAEVTAHGGYCGWRNCWRNCWRRNCWRNCY